jgi:hypothetical protein
VDAWEINTDIVNGLAGEGWNVFATSAKTGAGVERAFHTLAQQMSPA